jgi:hypothetical protein
MVFRIPKCTILFFIKNSMARPTYLPEWFTLGVRVFQATRCSIHWGRRSVSATRTEQNRDASRVYETSAESWGLSSAFSSNSGSHRVTVSSHRPEDESCSSQAANAPPMQTSNICRSFHPCKLKESKDIFPS